MAGQHRAVMLPSASLLDSFQTSNFTVMLVIYLVAIAAEAISGALAAGRRNMDILAWWSSPLSRPWAAAPSAIWCWATSRLAGRSTPNTCALSHQLWPADHGDCASYGQAKQVFLLLDAMGLIAFSLIGANMRWSWTSPTVVVIMAGMRFSASAVASCVMCCATRCPWCSGASCTPVFRSPSV